MKLTRANPPQKGFKRIPDGEAFRVLMDGRVLERVLRVDTVTGVAWVAEADTNGRPLVQKGELVVRRIYGPMRVERIDVPAQQQG